MASLDFSNDPERLGFRVTEWDNLDAVADGLPGEEGLAQPVAVA